MVDDWKFFFFSSRRPHTRLVGDWSSDVCSSDLLAAPGEALDFLNGFGGWQPLVYLFYFLLGYLIPAVPALERGMQSNGWLGLIAGCIAADVGVGLLLAEDRKS